MTKALDLLEETKKDNKIVAGWLLWYFERKQEYEQRREDLLHSGKVFDLNSGLRPGGGHSDITGARGTKLAGLQDEEWLQLIEEVERRLPLKMQIFYRLRREYRYCAGRNGWVAPVQWRYAEEIAKQLNKKQEEVWVESRQTFTDWWNRIVEYTVRIAAKKNLL